MGGSLLRQLLDAAINGVSALPGAKAAAAKHLVKRNDVESAIDSLMATHVGLASAQGFVTNLGGLPTMPIALPANIAGVAIVQIRLVGAIAHLRGYDIDSSQVRCAMMLCLLGPDGVQRLMDSGDVPAPPLTIATAPVFDASLDQAISEKVLGEFATRIGGRHAAVMFVRRLPVLGGGVGAAMDALSTITIGTYAREQFVNRRRITRN